MPKGRVKRNINRAGLSNHFPVFGVIRQITEQRSTVDHCSGNDDLVEKTVGAIEYRLAETDNDFGVGLGCSSLAMPDKACGKT